MCEGYFVIDNEQYNWILNPSASLGTPPKTSKAASIAECVSRHSDPQLPLFL